MTTVDKWLGRVVVLVLIILAALLVESAWLSHSEHPTKPVAAAAVTPQTTTTVPAQVLAAVIERPEGTWATTPNSVKPATTQVSNAPKTKQASKPRSSAPSAPVSATSKPKTILGVAQSQVGKSGSYTEGGFWCAKFASWVYQQAGVPNFTYEDSPAGLYLDARDSGRLSTTPTVGGFVFVDLTGSNFANEYVSHVGIVESIDGNTIHTIEGNADNSGVVIRNTRHIGDGYVIGFGAV